MTTTHGDDTRTALPFWPAPVPAPDGASLEVRHTADGAALRVTPDPLDPDAGARLLCAAVSHLRRRSTPRVHTALDLGAPTSEALLAALRSRVGSDVADIVLRRAGSSVMVTLELAPPGPTGLAAGDDASVRGARAAQHRPRQTRTAPHVVPHPARAARSAAVR